MSYSPAPILRPDLGQINVLSPEALDIRAARNISLGTPAAITWVANLAVFVPFSISSPFTVVEVWWYNGSGAGGNIDVGVYDTGGTKIFTLGTTAKGTVSVPVMSSALTDVVLSPGDYYMAFATDNSTASNAFGWAPAAPLAAGLGCGQMTTAFVLPSSATIVPLTNALLPHFGLSGSTVAP